jgi:hypothetical protein
MAYAWLIAACRCCTLALVLDGVSHMLARYAKVIIRGFRVHRETLVITSDYYRASELAEKSFIRTLCGNL